MKRNFLAGILVVGPFGLTFFILFKLGKWMAELLSAAPASLIKSLSELPPFWFQATTLLIGFSGTVLVVLITGALARNFVGGKLVELGERIISKIPIAGTFYMATKQIIETVFTESGFKGIKRVVMFEFPRTGLYALGFVTGTVQMGRESPLPDKKLLSVFMPTSPNPTSGYYLMIPEDEVKDLPISTEEAFKIIMSIGLASEQSEPFRAGT
ncbi:MAG: DUF502 domain-containing protein [Thermodesulfobacteriota bacterium]